MPIQKYTQFKDIPKFISKGNWACDYSLPFLVTTIERWEQGKPGSPPLQLNPDFQRGHVWTRSQQIAYVEFLLRGGTSGREICLNCPSWHFPVEPGAYDEFVCVDGLQRLTAIRRFINDEIPAFGSKYSEYTDKLRSINTIRVSINDLKSREEVLRWYLEMNAGGTPHSKKEIQRVRDLLETEKTK